MVSRFADLPAWMRATVATPALNLEALASEVAEQMAVRPAPDPQVERARAWLQQAAQPPAGHAARFLR